MSQQQEPDAETHSQQFIEDSSLQESQVAQASNSVIQIQGSGNQVTHHNVVASSLKSNNTSITLNRSTLKARNKLLREAKTAVAKHLKDFLEPHSIKLLLEEQPRQVESIWRKNVKVTKGKNIQLSHQVNLIEIFNREDVSGKLLILGAPGAGKTTALHELASELISYAEKDTNHPIPVILNLSSWKGDKQSIGDWIAEELLLYGVKFDSSKKLLDQDQILPLLDALDEVDSKNQRRCIHFINQFYRYSRPQGLIVCSRLDEYEKCHLLLELNTAIYLQPLTDSQIKMYLIASSGQNLWQSIENNVALLSLSRNPLFLFIITSIHREFPLEAWKTKGFGQEDYRKLFDRYIEIKLNEEFEGNQHFKEFTSQQTQKFLEWLAKQLGKVSQKDFLIEAMQPSWLQNKHQKRMYRSILCFIIGLSSLPICLLIGILMGISLNMPNQGTLLGGFITLVVSLTLGLFTKEIKPVETLRWPGNALIEEIKSAGKIERFISFGMFSGFGGVSNLGQELDKRFSLNSLYNVQAVSYIWGFFTERIIYLLRGLVGWFLPVKSVLRGLFLGLNASIVREEDIIVPNQGIWKSARNSLKCAILFGFIGFLLGITLGFITPVVDQQQWVSTIEQKQERYREDLLKQDLKIQGEVKTQIAIDKQIDHAIDKQIDQWRIKRTEEQEESQKELKHQSLYYAPLGGFIGVLLGGLFAGISCLQHFALRVVLYKNGFIPWNYTRFLNYATKHLLLQRVGGRYRFIHDLLRKHFEQR